MKNLSLYLVSIFLYSCTGNQPVTDNRILLLHPDKKTTGEVFHSSFELERIVPVETTHDFLLANVDRVIFYKSKIIILDTSTTSIFVVDASTGKVETHIHRKGRGPGDSMNICDIAFDERLEQILVFNDYKKLLYFTLDGSFLKEEFINESFDELTYDNSKVIFYNVGEGYGCFPYSLSIYDLQDHSWEKAGEDQKVDFPVRSYGCLLVKSKNIWFTPVLDFGLHRLNGSKIEVPYKIDQKPLSDELRGKSISDILSFFREVADHDILHSINSIRETDHYLIFQTNRSGFLMMNKKEAKLFREECVKDAYLGLDLIRYFPHDGADNRIMFVVFADQWLERSPQNTENIPEHLREQIDRVKVDEESNPVLVFYKEK
ncbi:MAG: 6-bladed beta-propeller [Bacteroidales bacterium]|jgi:hypothetical protein|nr:6-bladed beta-propeller [Bacteroidales bacterium]